MMKTVAPGILALCLLLPGAVYAQPQTEGGANQVAAQTGCMNQWMFNGMWRVRVTNVAFHPAGDAVPGWDVTMQWGNGTSVAGISPTDTMVQDMVLGLANGDTMTATDSTRGNLNQQQLFFHTFPAAGQFTYTQTFYGTANLDQKNQPTKLLVSFDVAKYKANHPGNSGKFWKLKTPAYNYRIDLTCSK